MVACLSFLTTLWLPHVGEEGVYTIGALEMFGVEKKLQEMFLIQEHLCLCGNTEATKNTKF